MDANARTQKTFADSPRERRAALRTWLRLSPEAQRQISQPRVYANAARQRRCVENIAKTWGLPIPQ